MKKKLQRTGLSGAKDPWGKEARWAGAATPRGAQNSGGRGQRLSSAREGEV